MGVFMGETVSELQDKKSLSWTKAKFDDWLRTWIWILQLKPNILIDEIFRWSVLFSYPYSPSLQFLLCSCFTHIHMYDFGLFTQVLLF